jgi:catechol 2,3-dioxygenase-like lactoylglutathione lyase family enzyme
MTASATSEKGEPFLALAEPQLFTADIKRACDFYTGKLGFQVKFLYGDPPFYGRVIRDGARLNLRHVDRPVFDRALRAREDLLSATIVLDKIEPLFLEYQARGAVFHQALRTEPWGRRTFIVADPDGNLIAFSD